MKDFSDLDGARDFIADHRNQRAHTGQQTYTLSAAQLAEANDAFKRLEGTGLSLTKALTLALNKYRRPEDALTWEAAQKQWLAAPRRRPLDPRTVQAYSISLQFFAKEMKTEKLLPHQVLKKDLEEYLLDDEREWEPATIGHHLRNLSSFFSWFAREKHCAENPAKGIPEPEVLGEIQVLTTEQAKHLLATASGQMRICVGLGLYGGLRTSEIRRLDWAEIGADEIEIKASKTKTRRNRMVPILPKLKAVLGGYKGSRFGMIAPERWKKEFEALVGAAGWRGKNGESTWPTNAMRHSYGTYRFPVIKNEGQLAAEMGNSPDMIHRHYRRVVSKSDVKTFWAS